MVATCPRPAKESYLVSTGVTLGKGKPEVGDSFFLRIGVSYWLELNPDHKRLLSLVKLDLRKCPWVLKFLRDRALPPLV